MNYVADEGVYLPAHIANGTTVSITSGSAALFAGFPSASNHRMLALLNAGQSITVSGLVAGEVLSVENLIGFSYEFVLPTPPVPEAPIPGASSEWVTATCTASPCPWGPSVAGYAIAWPESAHPVNVRLNYTFSAPIYLPAVMANGATIWVESGTVTLLASPANSTSHRVLATLTAGAAYTVSGLAPDELLTAQSLSEFVYQLELPPPPPPPPPGSVPSELVTLTCVLSPCSWGSSLSGLAAVWPDDARPLYRRYNYFASKGIYLPDTVANGSTITIDAGSAALFAGFPESPVHRALATLNVGDSYTVSGLAPGEVLSLQGTDSFVYRADLPLPPPVDPEDVMESVSAYWRCDTPGCTSPDWVGAVFNWPSWAAYSSNGRSGDQSRTVYSADGGLLYPYMGPWAHGCEITGEWGVILIVEWQRGKDSWRQTLIGPGETYVINLTAPEDGALIESWPGSRISVKNCEPQPLP